MLNIAAIFMLFVFVGININTTSNDELTNQKLC